MVVGLCVALLAGCGVERPGTGEPGADEVATESQELIVDGAACNPATLDATTCSGPYEYQMQCYAFRTNSSYCGESGRYQQKSCWNQCTLSAAVNESYSRTVTPRAYTVEVCNTPVYECDYDRKPPCQWSELICWDETRYDYNTPCQQLAESERNRLYPNQPGVTYSYSVSGSTCNFTLSGTRTYLSGPNNPACGPAYEYSCNDTNRPIYNDCRHSQHGTVAISECANSTLIGTGWSHTSSGLTAAQASSQVLSHWTSRLNKETTPVHVVAPRCVTCENETGTALKFSCLMRGLQAAQRNWQDNYGTGSTLNDTRLKLRKQLIMLYEARGHELTETQRSEIRTLLEAEPLSNMCGRNLENSTEANADCDALKAWYTELNSCIRLTSSHAEPASRAAAYEYCAGLESAVFNQSYGTCQTTATWHQDYVESLQTLAAAVVSEPIATNTGFTEEEQVQRRLEAIQSWYDAARNHYGSGPAADTLISGKLDGLMGAFWKTLYDQKAPFDSNGSAAGGIRLPSQFIQESLEVDRKVLSAAIASMSRASGPRLEKLPLVLTLGGGLRALSNRLDDMSVLHDLGCRFRDCKLLSSRTMVSETMGLIGSLHDASELNTRVGRVTTSGVLSTGWRNVFSGLNTHHAHIQEALTTWMGTPTSPDTVATLFLKTPDSVWPSLALDFVQLVKDASQRSSSYDATGRFAPGPDSVLHTGMQDSQFQVARGLLTQYRTALEASVTDYNQNEVQYVERLLAQMGNEAEQRNLKTQLEQRALQMSQLYEDLAGLKISSAQDEARFGDFMKTFVDAAQAQRAGRPAYQLLLEDQNHSLTAASSARYKAVVNNQTVNGFDISQLAVPTVQPVPLDAGDVLYINTTGAWSPTCALSKVSAATHGGFQGFDFSTIQATPTGPEGYLLQRSSSGTTAISNQSVASAETYGSTSSSLRACAGARADLTVKTPDPFGAAPVVASASVYGMIETCEQSESGTRTGVSASMSQDTTSQTGMSASFAMGIRSKQAPFPNLPTGSLLAVLIKPDVSQTADNIENIYLVQSPSTSIVAKDNVKVYLVANELVGDATAEDETAACASPDATRALSVNLRQLRPETDSTLATVATAAMAKLKTLRQAALQKQAQGRLMPEDSASLRDDFWLNMSTVPAPLRELVDQWVTRELAELSRAVERQAIQRQLELLKLEQRAINEGLQDSVRKAPLLQWLPRRALQNMDSEELRLNVHNVSVLLNDYLYPILELRYPVVLQSLRNQTGQNGTMDLIDDFIHVDFTASYSALADKLADVAALVESETNLMGLQQKGNPTISYHYLSIPRPTWQWDPAPQPLPAPQPPATVYQTVTPSVSEAVWDRINRTSIATIPVTPEDFFHVDGDKRLSCEKDVPIIRNMMVFFNMQRSSDVETARSKLIDLPLSVDGELVFPRVSGPQRYRMVNAAWLNQSYGRPLFGRFNEAPTIYTNWRNTTTGQLASVADGLSPFTRYDINVRALKNNNLLHLVTDIVLVFEVETRSGTPPMFPWIESCQQTSSTSSLMSPVQVAPEL